ncbi:hypothetical protein OIU78_015462, partial [Salix suchowensis]
MEVTFCHLKFNITLFPRSKNLKISLITIQNCFCIKLEAKCQVLLSN